ncbi:MAG: DUF3857 domain-containing protein [candidate division WOR-3 bacterium]
MKKNKILSIILFFIFLISCNQRFLKKDKNWIEDIIYTEKGEEYKCKINKITSDSVYIETFEGNVVLPKKEISEIDFAKKREGFLWKTVKDITDPILLKSIKIDLSKFKDKKFVDVYLHKELEIKKDSTYSYSIRCIRGISSEKGRDGGNISFKYRSKEEKIEINFARTITKEGEVLPIRENAIEDASVFYAVPPYENLRERKIALREVKPGNFLDFKVTIKGKISKENPFVLESIIGGFEPIIKSIIRVKVPRNFNLVWQTWKLSEPELKFSGRNKILEWEIGPIEEITKEENMPPLPYIVPRVIVGLKNDWTEIIKDFKNHCKGEFFPKTKEPQEIYKEIVGLVKSVDVPSYLSNLYPKAMEEILENKFANLLDKSFLLYSALKTKGYPVELILVGSKTKGEIAKDVPSLYQFDGALVKLEDTFLEPSSELIPYGYVSSEYQNTVGLSIDKNEFVKIPLFEEEKEKTSIRRIVELRENGDAVIEEEIKNLGESAMLLKNFRYLRKEEKENIIEGYLNENIPGAILENVYFTHIEDLNPEVKVNVKYEIPELAIKQEDFLLLHLPGIKYSAYSVGTTERKNPIYWGKLKKEENEIIIKIPKGFKVRCLPKEIYFSLPFIEFKNSFTYLEESIIYKDYFSQKEEFFQKEVYPEYKEIMTKIAELSEEWIILEKAK